MTLSKNVFFLQEIVLGNCKQAWNSMCKIDSLANIQQKIKSMITYIL